MAKKILITGGLGYIGVNLANYLTEHPGALSTDGNQDSIERIDLADIVADTPTRASLRVKHRVIEGDLASQKVYEQIEAEDYDIIFHLGGVGSAACEKDPSLADRNVQATKNVLEAAAQNYDGRKRKVIFASSLLAVEGIDEVLDDTPSNAQKPYGRSKKESENLGMVYADRVDFRGLRLSTMIANRAASTASTAFYFGLPNLLLRGKDCNIPMPEDFKHPLIWVDDTILGLVNLHNLPEAQLVDESGNPYRTFNVPSHTVTSKEWVEMVQSYQDRCSWGIGSVTWKRDDLAIKILETAGHYMRADLAVKRGIFPATTTTPQQMVEKIYQTVLQEKQAS